MKGTPVGATLIGKEELCTHRIQSTQCHIGAAWGRGRGNLADRLMPGLMVPLAVVAGWFIAPRAPGRGHTPGRAGGRISRIKEIQARTWHMAQHSDDGQLHETTRDT